MRWILALSTSSSRPADYQQVTILGILVVSRSRFSAVILTKTSIFRMNELGLDSPGEVPPAMHTVARRAADMDLLARLLAGSVAYPAMFLFIGVATPYRADHPYLFWPAVAAIALALILRGTVRKFREQLYARNRTSFILPLVASLGLSGGAAGFLLVTVAMKYGFSSWTFSLTMLWLAGIASGSTISFTPNFRFLIAQLLLLLAPVIVYESLLGSSYGLSIGLATLIFFGFHVLQGRRLNAMYWALSESRVFRKAAHSGVGSGKLNRRTSAKEASLPSHPRCADRHDESWTDHQCV